MCYRLRAVVVFDPKQPKRVTTTDLYLIDLLHSRNLTAGTVCLTTIYAFIYLYEVNFR